MCVGILAVFGLLVTTAYSDEPKSYGIELSSAKIGTAELDAGEYTMLVHRDGDEPNVRLTEVKTGNAIDVPAKVESVGKKFAMTEVHSRDVNGAKQISEIRIGGTKLRIDFRQGSSI
jgi:hypothetical protein